MKMGDMWRGVWKFVSRDAWNPESSNTRRHGILARIVRVCHLLYRGYMDDDLTIHATSLTYGTLTSLVPILAVAIALMRGFGMGQERLASFMEQPWVQKLPPGMQDLFSRVLEIVTETNFFALGWIGLLIFILTAVFLLSNIERSFNRVWGVEKERNIFRQITIYTSVLVFVPFLIGCVVAMRAVIAIQTFRAGSIELPIGAWGQHLFTFAALWAAIFFLFMFVPNTTVRFSAALVSSCVTTAVFTVWMRLFMVMQVGVASRNAIYGAFAAIPIFLFWLYITWVIWLLGAEFAFALQHSDTYHLERSAENASVRSRLLLAVLVLREAARSMRDGGDFNIGDFARRHTVPMRLLHPVVKQLCALDFLGKLETADERDRPVFVLKRTPEVLKAADVVRALVGGSRDERDFAAPLARDLDGGNILERLERGIENGFGETTVADLLADAPAEAFAGSKA